MFILLFRRGISSNILAMDKISPPLSRLATLALFFLSGGIVLIALTDNFAEPDMWGYLNFGKLFFHEPGFPLKDAFSYVPTNQLWVFHEWLTGVFLFRLYEAFGFEGIQVLKYALGLGTAFLVFVAARKRGGGTAWCLFPFLLTGAFYSWAFPAFRALAFTYFFFVLFFHLLENSRTCEQYTCLWVLPPIMLLWANLHGGFLAGLGLIFLYAVGGVINGRAFFPYAKILAICALVTVITPYGPELWKAIVGHLSQPQHGIREWVSVPGAIANFGPSHDLMLFVVGLLLAVVSLAAAGCRDWTAILVLGVTGFLGMTQHRHMPFFILSLGVFAPVIFQDIWKRFFIKGKKLNFSILVCLCCFLCMVMLAFNFQYFKSKLPLVASGGSPLAMKTPGKPYAPGVDALFYPVDAVNFLESSSFSGNILPYATWGGYISWRLHPRCQVAMDLRFETVYPAQVRDEYFDFLRCGPGWQVFLEKHPHDIVLVYAGEKLHKALALLPEWEEIYRDHVSVIFARTRTWKS